tara:strand:- start:13 stop:231 length:219 start_codon:yes stop_codon:yes gene_type:complete
MSAKPPELTFLKIERAPDSITVAKVTEAKLLLDFNKFNITQGRVEARGHHEKRGSNMPTYGRFSVGILMSIH